MSFRGLPVRKKKTNGVISTRVKATVVKTVCPPLNSVSYSGKGCDGSTTVNGRTINESQEGNSSLSLTEIKVSDCLSLMGISTSSSPIHVPKQLSSEVLKMLTTPCEAGSSSKPSSMLSVKAETPVFQNSQEGSSLFLPTGHTENSFAGNRMSTASSLSDDSVTLIHKAESAAESNMIEDEEAGFNRIEVLRDRFKSVVDQNDHQLSSSNKKKNIEPGLSYNGGVKPRGVSADSLSEFSNSKLMLLSLNKNFRQEQHKSTEGKHEYSKETTLEENDDFSSPKLAVRSQHWTEMSHSNSPNTHFSDKSSPPGSDICNPQNSLISGSKIDESCEPGNIRSCSVKKTEIKLFKKFFRSRLSIILVGNWEIPVHMAIIRVGSPLLATKIMRSHELEDDHSPSKKYNRRRTQTLVSSAKEIREFPLTFFRINKPPRAVLEFLKSFYPQCKCNVSLLNTWAEVLAVYELSFEYKLRNSSPIKKQCFQQLRTTIARQSLGDLLHVYNMEPELQIEILDHIAERLLIGLIDGDELGKFDSNLWNRIMCSQVWRERPEGVVYSELIVHILTWTAVFMSEVSVSLFTKYLDQAAGFPENSTAMGEFCNAVKTEVVDVVLLLIDKLRPELQVIFWHRLSDYLYEVAKVSLHENYSMRNVFINNGQSTIV